MNNAPITAPQAKIKVLSLAHVLSQLTSQTKLSDLATKHNIGVSGFNLNSGQTLLDVLRNYSGNPFKLFHTVGNAEELRIDEQYGTQLVYEIGRPRRPAIVPGNESVNISISTVTINAKTAFSFITSTDYWHSPTLHKFTGTYDYAFYTYIALKSVTSFNDSVDKVDFPIYAVMPVSSSLPVSSGSAKIVNNVSMTGYKLSLNDLISDLIDTIEGN